ncbi:TrkA-N domain protein [Thermosinus carboxydivorans Nor1]|uniref:Trk system potassium uptake protein TrkA n=1 Tax=Thermosinus carboxydivorans Nor1 TaxID=401526 RepID=A1HP21_9FIRM|nr:Trk system potassium transporter TrkA [Thermosinus carboxydivorans]EAX48129.1 TrkA-N domain protein [Thermosinus carboxydivorans Nor1]
MRVVIVGAGKVGYSLAQRLSEENHEVVVIEKDEERRSIVQNNLDVMTIAGNGASPRVLTEAGIEQAKLMIAVTDSDEVNMIACMAAKQAGVARTIARVRDPEYAAQDQLVFNRFLGVDLVINPEMVTAIEISRIIRTPAALDVEDFAGGKVRMLEVKIRSDSPLVNVPLRKLTLPPQILVAGILRQARMIIPRGTDVILPHDSVFFVGEHTAIEAFEGQFMNKQSPVERVMIIGAGRIGRHLAVLLEKNGLSVKVLDKDRSRCQELAKMLTKGMVLCGDGTDIDFLAEEGVGEADAVICLTDDDKLNLLMALLAKHLGAQKTFVRVGRSEYIPLLEQVGIDVALSPRLLTAGAILRLVRRGDIVHVSLLEGAKAEAMEIIVSPNCDGVGKRLKDIHFPRNALVGAIVRQDRTIVPDGNEILCANDRAIVFALPDTVGKVVEFFEGR